VEYIINDRYPVNTSAKYKFTQISDVKRIFEDGAEREFSRELVYYLTIAAPSGSEDGFQELFISIDSMEYYFKEKDMEIKYDSQDEESMPPLRHKDFEFHSIPLGKNYEIFLSPYGEVAKIEGQKLLDDRLYIEESGLTDKLKMNYWMKGLSDLNLTYISDIAKGILPNSKVTRDTSWTSPFMTRLEGVFFRDTAITELEDVNVSDYTLVSTVNDLTPDKSPAMVYGIDELVSVTGGKASGTYIVNINTQGIIGNTQESFEAVLECKAGNISFRDKVKKLATWELDKHYRW
ncbi:MAG: hypothetical protein ACOC2K_01665, partial [Bacteroidota bacterium]